MYDILNRAVPFFGCYFGFTFFYIWSEYFEIQKKKFNYLEYESYNMLNELIYHISGYGLFGYLGYSIGKRLIK